MAKITITIQASNTKLDTYAEEQGYLDMVAVGQEENGDTIMGANPQTKQEFLAELLQKEVTRKIAKVRLDKIDKEVRDQRNADKLVAEKDVSDDILVSVA